MVGDQLKSLCFFFVLGLAAAKFNVSSVNLANMRKPHVSASFGTPFEWDHSFCDEWENADTFPHPDSCSEFFMCWDGLLWELECEDGMLFDPWDGVCDDADSVTCLDDQLPEDPNPDDDECPPPGSNEVRFLPSPYCDEFYICLNGQPILMFCRPGQHWNVEREFCDDPQQAGCDVLKLTNLTSNYFVSWRIIVARCRRISRSTS